ncbi:MAG: hypothetical protein JWN99_3297 [Ilumatobacteraceae bacterium]|nr:hypothetical protein [Ilumatobacteraceae bacterium]
MAGNPLTDPNWAPELADTVERLVAQVRDKATNKVVLVVRALVFGLLIVVTAVAALVLAIIIGTKLLQTILHIGGALDHDSTVWISYLVVGGILMLAGLLFMRRRESNDDAKASK